MKSQKAIAVMSEVKKVIAGKDTCIEKIMAAILAGGHVLLEDVPGVGKTEMALAFSKALGLQEKRIQFTPDVMPADVTGFSMYRKDLGKFVYQEGAVMCNLLLADEINRTSSKTQSALLEVMEEGQVTVDGVTRTVPDPFIVLATQNPFGFHGTQRLPEAQMDRFLICISIGYPEEADEIRMMKDRHKERPMDKVTSVADAQELIELCHEVESVFIHDRIYQYLVRLSSASRKHPMLELGLSPRGTLALSRMSQSYAFLDNRDYVNPEDVQKSIFDVAMHRIRLGSEARVARRQPKQILQELLERVEAPKITQR